MNSRWHVLCARLEYPELIAARKMAEPFQGGTVLIEDTPSGAPLTQKLQREGFARHCQPNDCKITNGARRTK